MLLVSEHKLDIGAYWTYWSLHSQEKLLKPTNNILFDQLLLCLVLNANTGNKRF